jgi:hypothetical protein
VFPAGKLVEAKLGMPDDALDALLEAFATYPETNPDDPVSELFNGPSETLKRLEAVADKDANGQVILRSIIKSPSAKQRMRSHRLTRVLQNAQASFLGRMDDYYPDDIDYSNASARFIDLLIRALDGDARSREEAALYLGIETEAVFRMITQIDADIEQDRNALKKAIKVNKGVYAAPAETGMVGVPGTTTWMITAKSVGTATVTVKTTSPGGQTSSDGKLKIIVMKK